MPFLFAAGRRRRALTLGGLGVAGLAAAFAATSAVAAAPAGRAPAGAPVTTEATTKAAAKKARPVLSLVASRATIQAQREKDEDGAFVDLGIAAVAGDKPLSVWVRRPVYTKPPTATLVLGSTKRVLPKGMADLTGLRDFTQVTVTDAKGRPVPAGGPDTTCLSNYGAARYRPDAPATSPYPFDCAYLPFALGAVTGLQAGWVTPLPAAVYLPNGTYTARVRLGERWRKLLGVPVAAATATTRIVVTTAPSSPGPSPSPSATAVSAPAPAPAVRAGHDHRDTGEAAHDRRVAEVRKAALASGRAVAPHRARPTGRATSAAKAAPRPDLQALPSTGITIVKGKELREEYGEEVDPKLDEHHFLTFDATVWNAGPSPLVVEGFRRPGAQLMDAYQYFYKGAKEVGYARVGSMEYDTRDGHEHWHFKDFAQYSLLDAKQKLKVRSQKEAFCLAPTDAVDLTRPGAQWKPGSTGLYTACGGPEALGLRETLEAGWGDTYAQWRPGQSFDVQSLPNGTYYIEILANPDRRLQETNLRNNRSLRQIVLSGTPKNRQVRVLPYQGIDAG
jgi:hypothetical protein